MNGADTTQGRELTTEPEFHEPTPLAKHAATLKTCHV